MGHGPFVIDIIFRSFFAGIKDMGVGLKRRFKLDDVESKPIFLYIDVTQVKGSHNGKSQCYGCPLLPPIDTH